MNPANWKLQGQYADYSGHRIFYQDIQTTDTAGQDCLLLIHGFPTSGYDWWKIVPDLDNRFRLIIPDMLGFGFSDKPQNENYTIGMQADILEWLLARLNISKVHVLSHNYGDTVAQELLARSNEQDLSFDIRSVCLLNGGLFPESYRPRLIQKLLLSPLGPIVARLSSKRRLHKTFNRIFGKETLPTDSEIDMFWELMTYNDGKAVIYKTIGYMKERKVHAERWVSALQDTKLPIRLIDGLHDPISGRGLVTRYRQLIVKPDVVELPDIGHYPQFEAPNKVVTHFLNFIDELPT